MLEQMEESTQHLGTQIFSFVKQNYTDPNICANSIAEHFHISRSMLYKLMRSVSPATLNELISQFRIDKAISLIQENQYTITDISKMVGYDSYCTFKRVFISLVGIPPSEYKKQLAL